MFKFSATLLFLLLTAVPPASAGPFLCSSNPLFELAEQDIVNVLDWEMISHRDPNDQSPVRLPYAKRMQCGLSGENWRVCLSCQPRISAEAYAKVLPMLASHDHREWHFLWHGIRARFDFDGLNSFAPEEEEIKKWQAEGWIPADAEQFARDHKVGGTLAGEDFLYMHRQMIKMLQIELANLGESCIAPWYELPARVTDAEWPAPRAVMSGASEKNVADEQKLLDQIRKYGDRLREGNYLRGVSLAKLGTEIEKQIHGKLHVMYASPTNECLNPNTDDREVCDDLTHDRSSHVNFHFWKLHGYIDKMINDWLQANGYKYIMKDCASAPEPAACYTWKGTWLGKVPGQGNR